MLPRSNLTDPTRSSRKVPKSKPLQSKRGDTRGGAFNGIGELGGVRVSAERQRTDKKSTNNHPHRRPHLHD